VPQYRSHQTPCKAPRRAEGALTKWKALRKSMNDFSALRNEIAHLISRPKYSLDPAATAVVRLVPPFWKPTEGEIEFEKRGYSWDQLTHAIAPFWGYDPSLNIRDASQPKLIARLDDFRKKL
jgi:hypothetical protein